MFQQGPDGPTSCHLQHHLAKELLMIEWSKSHLFQINLGVLDGLWKYFSCDNKLCFTAFSFLCWV